LLLICALLPLRVISLSAYQASRELPRTQST